MAHEPPIPEGDKPAEGGSSRIDRTIGHWAKKSAGIPGPSPNDKEESERQERRQLLRLGGMGFQIVGTVVIFLLIGHWLDVHFHWQYMGTIVSVVIALIGSLYLLIKEAMRLNK